MSSLAKPIVGTTGAYAATGTGPPVFATTHWSVVLSAQDKNSPQSDQALETLCRAYWYPLYVFVRRQGHTPPDSEDLVQEFFARLLRKDYLQAAQPERGRFRTFLIMALKRFLAKEWDRDHAQKRGAGQVPLSLDTAMAERCYQEATVSEETAEEAFERQWAISLLDRALTRLRQEQQTAGKSSEFKVIQQYLTVDQESVPYHEAASQLGLSEVALRSVVHRLRRRYRVLCREEIAQTVADPQAVDEEIRHLLQVLSG